MRRKRFGKELYEYVGSSNIKTMADNMKKTLEKQGYKARVVKRRRAATIGSMSMEYVVYRFKK